MSAFRIVTRVPDLKYVKQGMGWFVSPNLVITAAHVLGEPELSKFGQVQYRAEDIRDEPELSLRHRDVANDLAILHCDRPYDDLVLRLARALPQVNQGWRSDRFKALLGAQLGLSGTISGVVAQAGAEAIQLGVKEGTDQDWSGISGAPVVVDDEVVGTITKTTSEASTAWACLASAIRALETSVLLVDAIQWRGVESSALREAAALLGLDRGVIEDVPQGQDDFTFALCRYAVSLGYFGIDALLRRLQIEQVSGPLELRKQQYEITGGDLLPGPLVKYLDATHAFTKRSQYRVLATATADVQQNYVPLQLQTASAIGSDETTLAAALINAIDNTYPPNILVVGGPGAGKTTVVNRIARFCWASPSTLGLPHRFLPLLLRLPALAGSTDSHPGAAVRAALRNSLGLAALPDDFIERWAHLTKTAWIVLLDAFDEVPTDSLSIAQEVIAYAVGTTHLTIVMTRDEGALTPLIGDTFRVLTLQHLSDEAQRRLAQRALGARAQAFQAQWDRIQGAELIDTPLLMTLAILIYLEEGGMPTTAVALYGRFIELMQREVSRRGLDNRARIVSKYALKYLSRLAFFASDNEVKITYEDAITVAGDILDEDFKGSTPAAIIQEYAHLLLDIVLRSGILFRVGDELEWSHRTLQEYLAGLEIAAHRISNDSDLQTWAARWEQYEWRQIVSFLLCIYADKRTEGSSRELIETVMLDIFRHGYRGMEFVSNSVALGFPASSKLRRVVINALCDAADADAAKFIGSRLLLSLADKDAPSTQAVEMLARIVRGGSMVGRVESLVQSLVRRARQPGQARARGIYELEKLRRGGELRELALDKVLPGSTRSGALEKLAKVTRSPEIAALSQRLFTEEVISGETFVNVLANLESPNELVKAFYDEGLDFSFRLRAASLLSAEDMIAAGIPSVLQRVVGSLPTAQAQEVVRELQRVARVSALRSIAQDDSLEPAIRGTAAAALMSFHDVDIAGPTLVRLIRDEPENSPQVEGWLDALIRSKNFDAVFAVGSDEAVDLTWRIKCLDLVASSSDQRKEELLRSILFTMDRHIASNASDDLVWKRIEILVDWRKYAEALGTLDELLAVEGSDARALKERGYVRWLVDDIPGAIDDMTSTLVHHADDSFVWAIRGAALRESNRVDEAIADLDRAMEVSPEYIFAYKQRARCHLAKAHFVQALADMNQAIRIQDTNDSRTRRANIYVKLGLFDQATHDLTHVIENDPDDMDARIALIGCRHAREEWDAVISECSFVLAKEPGSQFCLQQRCGAFIAKRQYADALNDIDLAIASDVVDSWSYFLQYLGNSKEGNHEQASLDLERAISLAQEAHLRDPTDFVPRINRALYSAVSGDIGNAEALYDGLRRDARNVLVDADVDLRYFLHVCPERTDLIKLVASIKEYLERTAPVVPPYEEPSPETGLMNF